METLRTGPHMGHLFRKMVPQSCPGLVLPGKNQAFLLIQSYDTYIAKCDLNVALVTNTTVSKPLQFLSLSRKAAGSGVRSGHLRSQGPWPTQQLTHISLMTSPGTYWAPVQELVISQQRNRHKPCLGAGGHGSVGRVLPGKHMAPDSIPSKA